MIGMQCPTCRHFKGDSRCRAFPAPREIPSEILTGERGHDKPWPGQVGTFVWTEGESEELRKARRMMGRR